MSFVKRIALCLIVGICVCCIPVPFWMKCVIGFVLGYLYEWALEFIEDLK